MSASDSTSTSANRLNSESTSELIGNSSNQLPNTGTEASKSSIVLGALAGVTGLGLLAKRRHDENEDEA
jgi:LPXTG-motif cell wall anchor domain protein